MWKKYFLLVLLLGTLCTATAQSPYYYYFNKKIYLDVDRERVAVNATIGGNIFTSFSGSYDSIYRFTENNTRRRLVFTDALAQSRAGIKNYYTELKVTNAIKSNQIAYANFINTLSNNSSITKVSACYKTKGGDILGLTNNFYVKLKSVTDQHLLYSLAQTHNLEVLGKNKYMGKWYVLSCAKNSPLNALEYANLFYETGHFEATEPEFVLNLFSGTVENEDVMVDFEEQLLLVPNDPLYPQQ